MGRDPFRHKARLRLKAAARAQGSFLHDLSDLPAEFFPMAGESLYDPIMPSLPKI